MPGLPLTQHHMHASTCWARLPASVPGSFLPPLLSPLPPALPLFPACLQLADERNLDLSHVRHFVVDECDKCLENIDMRADVQVGQGGWRQSGAGSGACRHLQGMVQGMVCRVAMAWPAPAHPKRAYDLGWRWIHSFQHCPPTSHTPSHPFVSPAHPCRPSSSGRPTTSRS